MSNWICSAEINKKDLYLIAGLWNKSLQWLQALTSAVSSENAQQGFFWEIMEVNKRNK